MSTVVQRSSSVMVRSTFQTLTISASTAKLPDPSPQPITSDAPLRYADAVVDSKRNRLICVREDHTDTEREAVNALVDIGLDGTEDGQVLVSGNDFILHHA